jgi:hypothetical protein
MVHPALFIGLFAAKKAIAVTLYYSLKSYGFPRAYRRLLEANKRLTPAQSRASVARALRVGFDAPARVAELVASSDAATFAGRLAEELRGKGVLGKAEAYVGTLLTSGRAAADFFGTLQREADADAARRRGQQQGEEAGARGKGRKGTRAS